MNTTLFLQLFLLLNVFLIGALTTIAVQHALAHFRPHEPEPVKTPAAPIPKLQLPAADKQKLLDFAQRNFLGVLDRSTKELGRDLQTTADQLTKQLDAAGAQVISTELEQLKAELEKLRNQAQKMLGGAELEVGKVRIETDELRANLKIQVEQELAEEKQKALEIIDSKLSDAMASFLLETLGHNVDLGAQNEYLVGILEAHKDDFKKQVTDEA